MQYLIAKVKSRRQPHFYKLLSGSEVYDTSENGLQLDNLPLVDYEPDHNLDEDSWFKIDNFSQQNYCIDLLRRPFVSAELNDISSELYEKVAYLCAIQGGNFFFQKVTPSLLATRKMVSFGESVELERNSRRIVVKDLPDAIYIADQNRLVFKSLPTISSIFPGIDQLYKEATNEEVQDFLNKPFLELNSGFNLSKVSKPNRSRISLATETLSTMSANDRAQIVTYIDSYCDDRLTFDQANNRFKISTDEELKYLLYGIEQRFYTTPLGQEKRLANSVQTLSVA
ncbi:hypothetical protein ACWJJH_01720 [Endozoicomonadaceae bacterium StTr2]